jgi:hypothetical protein
VLVEGLPGTGKTTTSEQIVAACVERGESCAVMYELAEDHPLFGRNVRARHEQTDYDEICLQRWASLIDCVGDQRRLVFDGCAMQSTVRFMFEQNWPASRIALYWQRFEQSVRRVPVALVYLAHARPTTFVREQMVATRADVWPMIARHVEHTPVGRKLSQAGFDAPIEFWVQYRRLCDTLVAHTTLPTLTLDITAGWLDAAPRVMGWLEHIDSRPTA